MNEANENMAFQKKYYFIISVDTLYQVSIRYFHYNKNF